MSESTLFEHQKDWGKYTPEETMRIWKMLERHAFGDIILNFNDTFGYALAAGVELDQWDFLAVTELYEKFGDSGVVAWGCVKEGFRHPLKQAERFPKFEEARDAILADPKYYDWLKKIRENDNE